MAIVATTNHVRVIQDLRHRSLRLVAPLYVVVEDEAEAVVASNADLDVFGYGDTEAEALEDLRDAIVETYFELREDSHRLGPHLENIWQYLDRIIFEAENHAAEKA
jgi:hypothetical protein